VFLTYNLPPTPAGSKISSSYKAGEKMLKKLLQNSFLSINLVLLLTSCRPPQEATEFNTTDMPIYIDGLDQDQRENLNFAEEKFIQTATTKSQEVEIIWVIDNSGSMENNQTKLAESFDSFIDTFLVNGKSDFPFKMGVTTTEAYRNDKDKWEDYDLTSYAAESDLTLFKENFKKAVKVGDGGSGDERCLESAFTMVENDPNWFGGDETLSVYILVSDEPEQSFKDTNNNDITIAQWAQKFQNLKSDPANTKFYPIVAIEEVQYSQHTEGDIGNRYLELAQLTGGIRSNIHEPFDAILENIGNTIKDLVYDHSLNKNRKIAGETVKVYINGVEQKTGWEYTTNAIKMDSPPAAGSEVRVTYWYEK
tara:strand:+ start:14472 stop:15566 length:1095 start_codon:yes stop_codon:yes gene_type:complete